MSQSSSSASRAGNGTRTRDPNLGKVVLYQLSYSREDPVTGGPDDGAETPPPAVGPAMEARGIEPLTS